MDTNKVMEEAGQIGNQVKNTVSGWTEKAKGTVRDTGAAADLYVHEYAWTTLAVVAAATFLVGYLLGRRES